MAAQARLWGLAAPGVRLSGAELCAAILALIAQEPRTADELAAAIGVPRAVARNTLASLALVDGVVHGDADGRYHATEAPA